MQPQARSWSARSPAQSAVSGSKPYLEGGGACCSEGGMCGGE